MSSINNCVFSGNLVRDPEVRNLQNGKVVANFTLAINDGGRDKQATFLDFEAWDKTAELVNDYLKKGSGVAVISSVQQESWEKDGQKRTRLRFKVSRLIFLNGGKKVTDEENGGEATETDGNDIPF